jgi:hypothetical protein
MIEKQYRDIHLMLKDIREHVEEFNTYVISSDDISKLNIGWYCPSSSTYFYTKAYRITYPKSTDTNDAFAKSIYDHKSVRDELSIYLSNCRSKEEYDLLRARVNKLKSFW